MEGDAEVGRVAQTIGDLRRFDLKQNAVDQIHVEMEALLAGRDPACFLQLSV
jgi:hypothetical protein